MGESNSNWQEDEKIQLCDSWARVIVCPITGKCISSAKLWEKVHADYVEHWKGPPTKRGSLAMQSQFRILKKMLKDWHNAKIKPRSNITSGTNLMDEMNQAHSNYMKKYPKQFDKWDCWDKVKHHPYFVDPPFNPQPMEFNSTPSASGNDSPIHLEDDIVLETPSSSITRPIGRKGAKDAKRKAKKVEDTSERMALAIQAMAESNQASVELMRKRNEEIVAHTRKVLAFEEEKEDAKVMAMDTNSMSPQSKAWWKKKKTEIIAKTSFDSNNNGDYVPYLNPTPQFD